MFSLLSNLYLLIRAKVMNFVEMWHTIKSQKLKITINLAAFLYPLFQKNDDVYRKIRDIIRIAAPFFDDFYLRPLANNPEQIQLEWKQKHLEQPFLASQLSDGTLRFVCLVTALLQPREPSVIIIDEPELGLHPFALSTIANLMKQVSNHTQIIVATQSPTFLDYFDPASIIVIDREQDRSVFKRLEQNQLTEWLKEYTLGELWQKNVLGGSSWVWSEYMLLWKVILKLLL